MPKPEKNTISVTVINPQVKFAKINKILDEEHEEIFVALDNLYNICKNHWATESILYKQGKKLMPKNHSNIDDEWCNHENEHKLVLNRIKELKVDIINHIKKYDKPHFHWTD